MIEEIQPGMKLLRVEIEEIAHKLFASANEGDVRMQVYQICHKPVHSTEKKGVLPSASRRTARRSKDVVALPPIGEQPQQATS